jgi:PKD repeat protein
MTPAQSAPVASFTGNPLTGTLPLSVQFTDASTNTSTNWSWIFGDIGSGNTSALQNPLHTYTSAGIYSVSLTATNAGGSNTTVKSNYITVTSPPPAISTVSIGNGYIEQPGEEITLTLLLDAAPQGFSGYNINITLGSSSIANITDITFPTWAEGMNFQSTLPANQNVLVKASDVNNIVQAGASNVVLGNITFTGSLPGSTTISLSGANFDDETGLDIPLSLTPGNLNVNYPLTDPLIINITPSWAYNDKTATIQINGTGFREDLMTVKLTRPGSPDIVAPEYIYHSRVRIDCPFNITGAQDGIWNLTLTRLSDGKTTTLMNGFTIVRPLIPVQGMTSLPVDLNGDGKVEDLNANGQRDYADVNTFYSQFDWITDNEPIVMFDFSGNGTLGFGDIVALFDMIS